MIGSVYSKEFVSDCKSKASECVHSQSLINCTWYTDTDYSTLWQHRKMAVFVIASVVDRHSIDADPDPTYHFDVDPNPILNFTHAGK
jgi:hypothetical protein